MNKWERLDLAQRAAQNAYAYVLDVEGQERESVESRVIALLLAATWAAVENGSTRPWRPGIRPQHAAMQRHEFLAYAADVYDAWQGGKPGAHLRIIVGGRE